MFGQMYPSPPSSPCPWIPPLVEASGGQEWYKLVCHWPELMFCCLQCSIDHLEFSRVHPHPQYRHLVLKSGITAGQHDMSSAWGSDWCFVRCIAPPNHPYSPQCPQVEASGGQEWYKPASHWPEIMLYCLQCSIDHLEFSRVHLTPVQASSAQEWYYCRSAWHLVRLMFGQMYSPPHHPHAPSMPPPLPPVQASSGQEQYYIRSDWYLVSHLVRLTCLCEGKSGASSHVNSSSMNRY